MLGKYEFSQWEQRVHKIVDDVDIPWEIHIKHDQMFKDEHGNGRLYLQIQFDDIDNVTGEGGYRAYCRKWYLSPYMTTQEIVRTCWLAYHGAVMHEAQEKFKYKGKMIYGPHVDPEALVAVAHRREIRANHARPETLLEEVQP